MRKIVTKIRRVLDAAAKACELLTWLILLTWVTVITIGVVMRYVFASPLLFQVDLVSGLLAVFASLCFAGNLVREQHIRVDILTRHLPPVLQRWLVILSYFVTFIFAVLMVWASKTLIYVSFLMNSSFDVSGLPLWPFQAAFAFGFVLLACVSLLRFLEMVVVPQSDIWTIDDGSSTTH